MSSIRVKFLRNDCVKYVAHLDLMRMFERAIRRSGIPISYSGGFNPHPAMVFGLPLSVGVTSEAEYADFELTENLEPLEFMDRLNSQLPNGFKIIDAKRKETKDNIMAALCRATYDIMVSIDKSETVGGINEAIDKLMSFSQIFQKKEGKSGVREIDIRPMIYVLKPWNFNNNTDDHTNICLDAWKDYLDNGSLRDFDEVVCITMTVSAGSRNNLKPELVVSAIKEYADLQIELLKTHRTELFVLKEDRVYTPLDKEVLRTK